MRPEPNPQKTEAFAPAKVNLTLHVTGQRDDGYHLLDSLVVFADVGDRVRVEPSKGLSFTVSGSNASGVPTDASNLVLQAAGLMGVENAAIDLDKQLPSAAGIGGGSSDAAAVMRAFAATTGLALPSDAGLSLGADVPVCLRGEPTRMSGIGETLQPFAFPMGVFAVLVNPGFSVPTGKIFAALHSKANPPMPDVLPPFPSINALLSFLREQRNDLEKAATTVEPRIETVLKTLSTRGSGLVRMSGSGATCFALFDNQGLAELVAKDIQSAHPDWWVRDTALLSLPVS